MNSREYREGVLRTLSVKEDKLSNDLHMVLGLVTESSEIADVYKKHIAYDKPLDDVNIKEELGDLLFFIEGLMYFKGWTIEEVRTMNMEKLKVRYPEKYDNFQALNRDLVKERETLNNNI